MCKISGCRTPAIAQGLCAKHYMRQRRTGDPNVKLKPGPKPKRPRQNAEEVSSLSSRLSKRAAAAPSHEVLALRREVASLRRKVRALERQAAAKPKRALATARVSCRRVQEAPASDLNDQSAEVNFNNLKFLFAKTLPEIPHWYVKRTPENEQDYMALFDAIQKFGRVEKWRGRPYRYWHPGDGYKYWAMTSEIRQSWIINRAKVP
jgi:hypothetical protein